jgi:hypothetical protein
MAPKNRDSRLLLEEVFDAIPGLDEKFKTLIEDAFTYERIRDVSVGVTCKCCGEFRKYVVPVSIPDFKARVDAIDRLLTQAKGKPAETKVVDLNVTAVKTRRARSDERRAARACCRPTPGARDRWERRQATTCPAPAISSLSQSRRRRADSA